MSRYKIQSDKYTSINETTGTVQNLSSTDSITVTTDTSTDGLVIYPHGHISFSQQIYVKSESRVVEVAVVPFEESGKGGGGGTTIDAYSVYGNAGAHNSLYRGKDLTIYFTSGEMSKAIAAGTFADIFPGDYITMSVTVNGTTYSNIQWTILDCDYFLNHGGDTDTKITTHHVVVAPTTNLGTAQMNATDTTAGAYIGSTMWKTTMPLYATGIQNAFGISHVLRHQELLSRVMTSTTASMAGVGYIGASTDWNFYNVICNLFNEPMICGTKDLSSSFYDIGDKTSQLAAMQHNKNLIFTQDTWCWLSSVVSSSDFCTIYDVGDLDSNSASASGGVRPYFLLY